MYLQATILTQWLSTIPDPVRQSLWLIVVLCCFFLAVGILIGYIVGNRSLRKDYEEAMDVERHMGTIQKSIANNVGLGIIVYGEKGILYKNDLISNFTGFLNKDEIPGDLDVFLNRFDTKENHLKSNYLLSVENNAEIIRSTYTSESKIYDIKLIRKTVDFDQYVEGNQVKEDFTFVLVEDITKVKDDERRQKDLAANVSHELKTPLTVIRASEVFVKKLSSDNKPSYEEVSRWGNRILANAIRMQDIVEDFLVLAMSNQMKQMRIFEIYPVIEKAISNLTDYPNAENVRVIRPKNDAYPLGFGNSRLIMRIINNLLTNAVKYIDYEGKEKQHEIVINIVTTADKIGIQVEDNGRGIPEKDIEHLFERFYRVDNSGSRDVGGSGLGLAIAKEIAESHDGSINVTSRMNEGSTFTLFLPTAKSCFERIYEDAKDGVVTDIPFYKAVTDFFYLEEAEAAKSKGYSDIVSVVDGLGENIEKINDSEEIKVIAALGDERFKDLSDELTYVEIYEDYDDEDDDEEEIDEEEDITEIPDIPLADAIAYAEGEETEEPQIDEEEEERKAAEYAAEVLEAYERSMAELEAEENIARMEKEKEELERQKKKEAQEFLMQPVVQQSVKQTKNLENVTKNDEQIVNNADFVKLNDKDKTVIHPNSEKKMYNKSGVKLFEGKHKASAAKKQENIEEAEPIRSAVRQVLDEASAIEDKIAKNNETEGNR